MRERERGGMGESGIERTREGMRDREGMREGECERESGIERTREGMRERGRE